GKGAIFCVGQGEGFGCAAGGGDGEEPVKAFASALAGGGKQDMFDIGVPVYPSFAAAMPGQAGGDATCYRNGIDGIVPIVISRVGDGIAIGREFREYLYSGRGAKVQGFPA